MLDRSRVIEIVVAVSTVALMIGIMIGIGQLHDTNGTINQEGAQWLVGAIVGFVILLTAVGVGLAYALNDPPEEANAS